MFMAQQNLRSLLEAVTATANLKNAAGEIRDPETLLESGALAKLDMRHPGAYVIFLFDALADPSVAAYLATGSLSTDSGSLILALSLGVPVIAPALPIISELLDHSPVGLLYDPSDPKGLEETLRQAATLPRDQIAVLRRNALAKAHEWDWSSLKKEIAAFFTAATSLASVRR